MLVVVKYCSLKLQSDYIMYRLSFCFILLPKLWDFVPNLIMEWYCWPGKKSGKIFQDPSEICTIDQDVKFLSNWLELKIII